MTYILNQKADLSFFSAQGKKVTIDKEMFDRALSDVQSVINDINALPVDIFKMLGMRNLSAFIGELFVVSLVKESDQFFVKNPHQDGYPDLLLMNDDGKKALEILENEGRLRDKYPFSPFINGGVEVKATCGDVPKPAQCAKRGKEKPDMGDTRIELMKSYKWKAHHRETNNLIGIIWDFYNRIPQIVAVFFGNNLTEDDWGKIIQPKKGGGRTTSVSILQKSGVKKMYQNWVAVVNDQRYIDFINNYNKSNLISK